MDKTYRKLEVRPRHHDFNSPIPRHYDSGNAILSAERTALELIIPPGEAFFIRSVRRLAHRAQDPKLQDQIKKFIGQETMHSKETNRALEALGKEGIPVADFCNRFDRWLQRISRFVPAKICLAATAAAEHYTAAFAIWNISTRYADRLPRALRDLSYWHGAEELEHKAVAFDLLQEVSPRNYVLRALGYVFGMGAVYIWYRKAYRMVLKQERMRSSQLRKEAKKAREIRIPVLSWSFPNLFTYLRPGFHPDDLDDEGLAESILGSQI